MSFRVPALILSGLLLSPSARADEYGVEKQQMWMNSCGFSLPIENCACILEGFEATIPEEDFMGIRPTHDEIAEMTRECAARHPITPEAAAEVEARLMALVAQETAAAPFVAAPVVAAPAQQETRRTSLPWVPVNVGLAGPAEVFYKPEVVGPLSLSILHGSDASVVGLQLGGVYQVVEEKLIGFQIAPFNSTSGDVIGAQLGASNVNRVWRKDLGEIYGLQASLYNYGGGCHGLCIGGLVNTYDSGGGIHIGGIYTTVLSGFRGVQLGSVNIIGARIDSMEEVSRTSMGNGMERVETRVEVATQSDARGQGLQLGIIANYAGNYSGVQVSSLINSIEHELEGAQVGFVNYADTVRGVQIGVFNVARKLHGVQIGAINIAYQNRLPFMVLVNAGF